MQIYSIVWKKYDILQVEICKKTRRIYEIYKNEFSSSATNWF